MFKKILKITGIVLGSVVGLVALFYTKVYFSTEARMNKRYDITARALPISYDSASYELGGRLLVAKGCTDCHGEDLGGKIFIDDSALGLLVARNLTYGKGGLPSSYDEYDWTLALKHGVRRNMKPLLFMPSHEFTRLTDQDLAAIISHASRVPNVDRVLPQNKLGPVGRILTDLGKLPLLPAEMINHQSTQVKLVRQEVSIDFGKYLSVACEGCHRSDMKGGAPVAPGFPVVANITSTGNPGKWTEEQFINTLRTGHTPEGKKLNPKEMPWTMTKAYTDVELKALYVYLTSL